MTREELARERAASKRRQERRALEEERALARTRIPVVKRSKRDFGDLRHMRPMRVGGRMSVSFFDDYYPPESLV